MHVGGAGGHDGYDEHVVLKQISRMYREGLVVAGKEREQKGGIFIWRLEMDG